MSIRHATQSDLSRIAEIFVFNNRINYYPIFKDPQYSFGYMQVASLMEEFRKEEQFFERTYVYDDGLVKAFIQITGTEINKLYVDPFFQNEGIGHQLIEYAIKNMDADHLWALEKNTKAIAFYGRHGFGLSGKKEFEEGTTEYLVELVRENNN